MEKNKTVFETLREIDVKDHCDKTMAGGKQLSYLSWAWAWDYVKKVYPSANYKIKMWGPPGEEKPYCTDLNTGLMVMTSVTIEGETMEMWLPVLDGSNKPMKTMAYKYKTKSGDEKWCQAATMFEVNKALMRCLVKNLGMFGLGLSLYSGEDLPDNEKACNQKDDEEPTKTIPKTPAAKDTLSPQMRQALFDNGIVDLEKIRAWAVKNNLGNIITDDIAATVLNMKQMEEQR